MEKEPKHESPINKLLYSVDRYLSGVISIGDQIHNLDYDARVLKFRNSSDYENAPEPVKALVEYILSDEWKSRRSNELTDPAIVKLKALRDAVS